MRDPVLYRSLFIPHQTLYTADEGLGPNICKKSSSLDLIISSSSARSTQQTYFFSRQNLGALFMPLWSKKCGKYHFTTVLGEENLANHV